VRHCTGCLGDTGTEAPDGPMDCAAWFELCPDNAWHSCDARNNTPRIARCLMARGGGATAMAIASTFGPCTLTDLRVVMGAVATVPAKHDDGSTRVDCAWAVTPAAKAAAMAGCRQAWPARNNGGRPVSRIKSCGHRRPVGANPAPAMTIR
jgi:hypothetical protein